MKWNCTFLYAILTQKHIRMHALPFPRTHAHNFSLFNNLLEMETIFIIEMAL